MHVIVFSPWVLAGNYGCDVYEVPMYEKSPIEFIC